MRKAFKWGGIIYIAIQIALCRGYKNPKDSDYIIDLPSTPPPIRHIDTARFYSDTSQYKGNWTDPQE